MILVVDDDDGVREALGAALASQGYDVQLADSGLAAVRVMEQVSPDVIVSDVHMPDGDGFLVVDQARSLHPRPAVILVSAWDDAADRNRALANGVAAYLAKPFEMSRILSLVAAALRLSGSRSERP